MEDSVIISAKEPTNNSSGNKLKASFNQLRVYFKSKAVLVNLTVLAVILSAFPLALHMLNRYQSLNTNASPGNAAIFFNPANINIENNKEGSIEIFIDPAGEKVNAVELYISFDPDKILITNISPDGFFTEKTSSIGSPVEIIKNISSGKLHYAIGFPLGSNYYSSTPGKFATINYKTIASGTSKLEFVNEGQLKTMVSDNAGNNVFGSATNLQITIGSPITSPLTSTTSPVLTATLTPTSTPSPVTSTPKPTATSTPTHVPTSTSTPMPTLTSIPTLTPTMTQIPTQKVVTNTTTPTSVLVTNTPMVTRRPPMPFPTPAPRRITFWEWLRRLFRFNR